MSHVFWDSLYNICTYILTESIIHTEWSLVLPVVLTHRDTWLYMITSNVHKILTVLYEGRRVIRPWNHHIVFGTQIIRKIYSVPLRFYSEPPHVEFRTSQSDVHEKMFFLSYLILKKNNVDYHDGVHFDAMCKSWNIAKKIFRLLCCVKM